MLEVIGWSLVIAGFLLLLIASFGMLRMPDFYTSLHAASLADSAATILVCAGLAMLYGFSAGAAKSLILATAILLSAPTACHALAKAFHRTGKDKG